MLHKRHKRLFDVLKRERLTPLANQVSMTLIKAGTFSKGGGWWVDKNFHPRVSQSLNDTRLRAIGEGAVPIGS